MKIDLIVGARPNFIKAFPVFNKLQENSDFTVRLINTGQHYDSNMVDVFFSQLKMKNPDINFEVGSGSHANQTAQILIKSEKVFLKNRTDLVIVFGDVNSTIAAALAAAKLHIPVAHVESGLRSFDKKMPEEINRILTDQLSDILFTTSPEAKDNLINEGKTKDQIFFVGNTMIDSLVKFNNHFDASSILNSIGLIDRDYILVTMHRPSNVDEIDKFSSFLRALNRISENYPIVWPLHPRVRKTINNLDFRLNNFINIVEPAPYFEFMGLQKSAKMVVTDSGGVQEESTYFKIPCFTVRENTERPITISQGTNKLVGTNFNNLYENIFNNNSISDSQDDMPKLWDGLSSSRIAKKIESIFT